MKELGEILMGNWKGATGIPGAASKQPRPIYKSPCLDLLSN